MLDSLITSKTRLKLLLKFFVYATNKGHLRGLAEEFNESTNAIRKELNQLSEAGFLEKTAEHNRVVYRANQSHTLFRPLQNLVHSFLGIDKVVDQVMERAGDVDQVMLVGGYARGEDSGHLEVSVLGQDLNKDYLQNVAQKTSKLINKEIQINFEKPTKGGYIVVYRKT